MRLNNQIRGRIEDEVMKQLWPDGWADNLAKPIIEYLSSDKCKEAERSRRAKKEYPEFVYQGISVCTFYGYSRCFGDMLYVSLPFSYQEKNDKYGIRYSLDDDGNLKDEYGTDLPDDLKENAKRIVRSLKRKYDFHQRFAYLLENVTTTERLIALVPSAEDAVRKVCDAMEGNFSSDDDIDDINRLIGGDV